MNLEMKTSNGEKEASAGAYNNYPPVISAQDCGYFIV
jgi:hypothetical protein